MYCPKANIVNEPVSSGSISVGEINTNTIAATPRLEIKSDGGVNITGGIRYDYRNETLNTSSLTESDYMVEFSFNGNVAVTLPLTSTENGATGRKFILIKTGATGSVTISRSGGDVIDTVNTSIIMDTQYDRVNLISNGNGRWYTI